MFGKCGICTEERHTTEATEERHTTEATEERHTTEATEERHTTEAILILQQSVHRLHFQCDIRWITIILFMVQTITVHCLLFRVCVKALTHARSRHGNMTAWCTSSCYGKLQTVVSLSLLCQNSSEIWDITIRKQSRYETYITLQSPDMTSSSVVSHSNWSYIMWWTVGHSLTRCTDIAIGSCTWGRLEVGVVMLHRRGHCFLHGHSPWAYSENMRMFCFAPLKISILLTPSSPWYNRTGWLGVKHQLTYFNPITAPAGNISRLKRAHTHACK